MASFIVPPPSASHSGQSRQESACSTRSGPPTVASGVTGAILSCRTHVNKALRYPGSDAFNHVADRVYRFGDHAGTFARNHCWRFFMDPARRALYLDWNAVAEIVVGVVRSAYGRRVGHSSFEHLMKALMAGSPEFKQLWDAQRTAPLTPQPVRLLVPGLGELHVTLMRLPLPAWDEHVLFLLPPADTHSAELMTGLMAQITSGRERPPNPAQPLE